MKIIFISEYQNKVERGVENYVSELSTRLSKKCEIEVLISFKELIGKKADIIYPVNGGLQSLFCRIYSWLIGAKLILGGHAGIGRDDRWNLYMFPDLFMAFSQKGYDWAKKVNPFIKIVKIFHGVDLQKFNPQIKPVEVGLEKPIFVTTSYLDQYKRVDLTVRAVAKLKKGSLLVLGEGPEVERIDELGKKLLNSGLRKRYLRLVVPHNEVAMYLNASNVFTLVSKSSEAFGLAYLEAMACNLPIVATDDLLRQELVGGAGILIDKLGNIEIYSAVLQKAINRCWGKKPIQQVEKFSWGRIIKEYEKYFGDNSSL